MSRSGYHHDHEYGALNLWRANVDRAIAGKRGQAFLREMADALDAMPIKELIAGEVVRDSQHVCAIGAVALARKMDVHNLDADDGEIVGHAFGIARILACEIAYKNDEQCPRVETPEQRWARMRAWVADNLRCGSP